MPAEPLETRLRAAIEERSRAFSGELGVALERFDDGFRLSVNGAAPRPAASLIKLPLLVAALREVQSGRLKLATRYPLRARNQVPGNGVLKLLGAGLGLSLGDLLTLMIAVSDNSATNEVLAIVGAEAVDTLCNQLELGATRLVGGLQLPSEAQNPQQRAGARNSSSPQGCLRLLAHLYYGDLLATDLNAFALRALHAQLYTEALPRYLPTDPTLHPHAVRVANKSGCLPGLWHDAGIVFARRPYALVVMTSGSSDRSESWEQEGMMAIARLSKAVFDLLQA